MHSIGLLGIFLLSYHYDWFGLPGASHSLAKQNLFWKLLLAGMWLCVALQSISMSLQSSLGLSRLAFWKNEWLSLHQVWCSCDSRWFVGVGFWHPQRGCTGVWGFGCAMLGLWYATSCKIDTMLRPSWGRVKSNLPWSLFGRGWTRWYFGSMLQP